MKICIQFGGRRSTAWIDDRIAQDCDPERMSPAMRRVYDAARARTLAEQQEQAAQLTPFQARVAENQC